MDNFGGGNQISPWDKHTEETKLNEGKIRMIDKYGDHSPPRKTDYQVIRLT